MQELSKYDLNWCVRRLPEQLIKLLKSKGKTVFVAGGFIRSCIANEPIADIDMFCPSKAESEACSKLMDNTILHETENAFTCFGKKTVMQFIHRWTFDDPATCIESFDFTIARAAIWWDIDPSPNSLTGSGCWRSLCDDAFYQDLAAKRLVYTSPVRNEDAGGSMLRVLKFYQRGYRMPLESLGAVIARLVSGVQEAVQANSAESEPTEVRMARVLTGLLREVDPNVDPDHIIHGAEVLP